VINKHLFPINKQIVNDVVAENCSWLLMKSDRCHRFLMNSSVAGGSLLRCNQFRFYTAVFDEGSDISRNGSGI
jgi:hypothetical protein